MISGMNSERSWRGIAMAGLATALSPGMTAAPIGPVVTSGTAVVTQSGKLTDIKVSNVAVLNWSSFNIGNGEGVNFNQPNRASVVWNFINDSAPSQILGNLTANGFVILMNQNGFLFGEHSVVNVGGLVVSTGHPEPGFSESSTWTFSGMPPAASIVNYGNIKVSDKSSLFMIAEKVENHGILQAPDGTIGLYAGKEVLISDRPDGRGLSARVTLPAGSVDNKGAMVADGGTIAAAAQVVNIDGLVQANSIRDNHGVIELTAGDSISLGSKADLSAQGGADQGSEGGSITIKSGGTYKDDPAAKASVAGGVNGGNAGSMEISAPQFASLTAQLDGTASKGYSGGSLLIDPDKILVNQTGTAPAGTLGYNINSAFKGFKDIILQADSDITVDTKGAWNLANSIGTGAPGDAHVLDLESGGNITLKDSSVIKAGDGWAVTLNAGKSGSGSINIGGTAANTTSRAGIQATTGSIDLEARNNITIGNGSVTTIGSGATTGGSITAHAKLGDIKTGLDPESFQFNTVSLPGYRISASLGGISTAAGGNVTLLADAGSIYADAQGTANNQVPGSTGAFGALPGDVTIHAAKYVTGVFTVANGKGLIVSDTADVGNKLVSDGSGGFVNTQQGVDLQLIKGGWTVLAAGDIFVNEVRNPNGTFNQTALTVPGIGKISYYNDYAANAYADFYAGNGVILQSIQGTLPRLKSQNEDLAAVYPPILNVSAGAGGVYMPTPDAGFGATLLNEVVLFPSSVGYLSIHSSSGGGLHADPGGIARIVESDGAQYANNSPRPDDATDKFSSYFDFTYNRAPLAHADPPLHANGPVAHNLTTFSIDPVTHQPVVGTITDAVTRDPVQVNGSYIDIAGSMSEVQVSFAQQAQVSIGGNMFNAGLFYRQYSVGDESRLSVAGAVDKNGNFTGITYTSAEAKVKLDAPPNLQAIADAEAGAGYHLDVFQRLVWNPTTKELIWIGTMTSDQRDYLLNPVVPVINPLNGLPEVDSKGQVITHPVVLVADQQKVLDLYANSQNTHAPQGAAISISGPGKLTINSGATVDLGASDGIYSSAPDVALLKLGSAGLFGASMNLTVKGDLRLTSSRISTESVGGDINIKVDDGGLDVGSQDSLLSTKQTGIFTTGSGKIDVVADKDINVNGSRIATFRGGDISLTSNNGNIDAGQGGVGSLEVGGKLYQVSGIISLALGDTSASPGNITIDAVKGNFVANKGGVFQAALNGLPLRSAINITAGGDVDAGDSGVVGGSVSASAGGQLKGNFFGAGAVTLTAQQSISANAIGQTVSASSAQGNVSGTIIGGAVNVAGATVDATVISATANVSGNSSAAQVGTQAAVGNVGPARSEQSAEQTVARASNKTDGDDDERKRRLGGPKLMRTVGRVTVILPSVPKTP